MRSIAYRLRLPEARPVLKTREKPSISRTLSQIGGRPSAVISLPPWTHVRTIARTIEIVRRQSETVAEWNFYPRINGTAPR